MTARIRNKLLVALLSSAIAVPLLPDVPGEGAVYDKADGAFRWIALVGKEFFDVQRVKSLFQKDASSATKVLVMSVSATPGDAGFLMAGKGRIEVDYQDWERMYHAKGRQDAVRVMEWLSIGQDAVVRIADRGRFSRVIVRGKDPTMFTAGGHRCELLQLNFHRLPRAIRADGSNPVIADVYVRTDSLPNSEEASEITREITNRLGHKVVNAGIRADTWFIEDSSFPLWFPFAKDFPPLTFNEYKSRGEIWCFSNESGLRCTEQLKNRDSVTSMTTPSGRVVA